MPPLHSLQLRRLLLRTLSLSSSSYSSISSSSLLKPHISPPSHQSSLFPHYHHITTISSHFLSQPRFSLSRNFSSYSEETDHHQTALTLSSELVKDADSEPLPIGERLKLRFSHISPSPSLVLEVLNLSPEAGRAILGFNDWLVSNHNFTHSDETISFFIHYLGRRNDFKAVHDFLAANRGVTGPKSMAAAVERLVRAGRPTKAVEFFEKMEREYGFKREKESLVVVVEKLCGNGFANYAEKMVKSLANEFFPDEKICDLLIKGWCVDEKLDEANRLAGEMHRGGFELGTGSYNAILDCVCKLCRKKDPFQLQSEVEALLVDMDTYGIPRNVETFNVLINHLCKIRKTSEALNLFERMGEWGCYPNDETFLVLIRSLYQAARLGEGDEMIDKMKSAGYGKKLDKKAYFGFLNILCGIERVDHALSVFEKMKKDCEPGEKTYDLLRRKLCAHNRVDKANALYNEAVKRGVPLTRTEYPIDPKYIMKKVKPVKKEKKRETLPEKMARKRRTLKQIRLSYVKKPKKVMR